MARIQQLKENALMDITAGTAHNFNNSLAALLGAAESMYYGLDDKEELMGEIYKIVETSQEMTRRLMNIAANRTDAEDVIEVVSIKTELEQNKRTLKKLVGSRIGFEYIVADVDMEVRGTSGMISEILTNLVKNAKEAVEDRKRPDGQVQVQLGSYNCPESRRALIGELEQGCDYARIIVKDNGVGMTPEQSARFIDTFHHQKR